MKVLMISVNREEFPDPVYPIGMSLVSDAVEKEGHRVRMLDLRWTRSSLGQTLTDWNPDVVGLSVRNVDNLTWGRSVSYVADLEAVVAETKEVFQGPLVLGGAGYSLFPETLLRRLHIPYGVVGEGEKAFPALLRALSQGREPSDIPGVICHDGSSGPSPLRDATPPRPPVRKELLEPYAATGSAVGIQTKRGCAFRCTYCTYPTLEGSRLRLRDPDDVVDEIEELVATGIRSVFFVDDTFNVPNEHAEAICRRLVERRVLVAWSAFLHPGHLPQELATWMKRSGCAGLEFGTDSLSDPVLEELGKGFSVANVMKTCKAVASAGVPAAHYLLLGSPGETPHTLSTTLQTADALPAAAFIAMVGVRLYPGTELTVRARAEGFAGGNVALLEPTYYVSPGVEVDKVAKTLANHARHRKNWIVPGLDIRCNPKILSRLRQAQQGPTWGALLR